MSRRILNLTINTALALFLVPIAWISYVELGKILALRPTPVEVAGTGSMYPSLYWDESQGGPERSSVEGIAEYRSSPRMYHYFAGINLFNRTYLKPTLQHGDMVAFSSDATRQILTAEGKDPNLGFIKRIIGVPGDTIELRDGYVLRNGEPVAEPYIRTPRSTYGGSTLPECQVLTVPPNQYFVLGDNRKVSSDSRFELGLIGEGSIQFYLPLNAQTLYTKLWRDTSRDQALQGTPTLTPSEFYAKLHRLKPRPKLETSAKLRASALLADPTTSLDLAASLNQAGYANTVTGEFVLYGHFSADELWENLQANYETKAQLNSADYSDIGIVALNREVAGCPTQVIVGHLGGYLPATYPAETQESWTSARDNLKTVIPSWESALGKPGVDQDKLNTLLGLLRQRLALVEEVLQVITSREWMSDDLKARLDADQATAEAAEALAKELNGD